MALLSEDKHRKRVEALRELMKGDGLSPDEDVALETMRTAFEDEREPREFANLLEETYRLLPRDNPYLSAFLNALGGRKGMNLTQRREDYLKQDGSISARTLMRYEQEGAEMYVKYIEMAEDQMARRKELEEDEDTARDIDIQVLRERVRKLEDLVVDLVGFVAHVGSQANFQEAYGTPTVVDNLIEAAQELDRSR